ncbi:MAG: hypothetical protein AAF657_20130 [Acidobacteriota bacterium]
MSESTWFDAGTLLAKTGRYVATEADDQNAADKESIMADYRFELGIDWNAIPKPNRQAFLQTGFADVTHSAVVAPVDLAVGDTIAFVIFDTTSVTSQTSDDSQTGDFKLFWVTEDRASTSSSDAVPLQDDKSFDPEYQGCKPSIVFGNSFPMWDTGIQQPIAKDASGRFRLTITIMAESSDKTALMTWCDDPEMVVGPGGQGDSDAR